jgi:hypothetical protein
MDRRGPAPLGVLWWAPDWNDRSTHPTAKPPVFAVPSTWRMKPKFDNRSLREVHDGGR